MGSSYSTREGPSQSQGGLERLECGREDNGEVYASAAQHVRLLWADRKQSTYPFVQVGHILIVAFQRVILKLSAVFTDDYSQWHNLCSCSFYIYQQ